MAVFVVGVLFGLSCGVYVTYYCCGIGCDLHKQTCDQDDSNLTRYQRQTPAQGVGGFGMKNFDNSSRLEHSILPQIFDFLQAVEEIKESLPPFSEGGVIMLRKELLLIIHKLEYDVEEAIKQVKAFQESLKPKSRRRPLRVRT